MAMRNQEATYKAAFYTACILALFTGGRLVYLVLKYFLA